MHEARWAIQVPITFPGPVAGTTVAAAVLVGGAGTGVGGAGVVVGVDVSVGRAVVVGVEVGVWVGVWVGVCVGLAVGVGVGGRAVGVGVAGGAQAARMTRVRVSSKPFTPDNRAALTPQTLLVAGWV